MSGGAVFIYAPLLKMFRTGLALLTKQSPASCLQAATRTYATTVSQGAKVELRDYQRECIGSVLTALNDGHKRVGISLATGAGKTVVFTQLINQVPCATEDAGRTLILAHRRELVEQAASHCQRAYPDKTIEIEMGNMHASGAADITIASVQSIISKDRLVKYDPTKFKLVMVDEAHHIVAPGYLRTLKHFGLDEKRQDSPALVGVSATFSRFDGVRLGAAIDEIVYHKDYMEMITDKWLSDVIFTTVESTANLSRVRSNAAGDFQTSELSLAVNTDKINDITVRAWMARANGRRSTLVFCVDLAHVSELTRKFRAHGFDARFVTGDTPKIERGAILDAFKAGEFPVLINCSVFTEGTDIPNIDCIILARPTKSRNLLVQMIGRGMRLHGKKKNCHVIDLVSSLDTGIVTTPTLFGLDPDELVQDASVDDMRQMKDKKKSEESRQIHAYGQAGQPQGNGKETVTFTEYSSVLDLIADTSGEQHIHSLSDHAWVQVGPDRFVLSAPNAGYIRIERIQNQTDPSAPTYRAVEIRALPPGISKSPFAAPREILTALTFGDAVHGADSYACQIYPRNYIHRYQPWRKLPPTQGQLDFVNRMRGEGRSLRAEELTKGKAADMITKLKHGAKGQFSKIEAEQRKKAKETVRLENRLNKERVRVGPVAS